MPTSALGRGTVHAIQAGTLFGYEALVLGMIKRIRSELKDDLLPVVATGGLSAIITTLAESMQIEPNLTLDGLKIIGE